MGKAASEPRVCLAQRGFRIYALPAGKIDQHEKQIADFPGEFPRRFCPPNFLDFLIHFVENALDDRPVEAHAGGSVLIFLRLVERGEGTRHAIENAFAGLAFFRALGFLEFFPVG